MHWLRGSAACTHTCLLFSLTGQARAYSQHAIRRDSFKENQHCFPIQIPEQLAAVKVLLVLGDEKAVDGSSGKGALADVVGI